MRNDLKINLPVSLAMAGLCFIMTNNQQSDGAPISNSMPATNFSHFFSGAEIWDGSFQNGWGELNGGGVTKTLNGSVLNYDHTGSGAASTLNGTNATNGASTWNDNNAFGSNSFTLEAKMRFNEVSNGFRYWFGQDTDRYLPELYDDRMVFPNSPPLTSGLTSAPVAPEDGEFHTVRVAYKHTDPVNQRYHIWFDGGELNDPIGTIKWSSTNDTRLLFGDTTSGAFGDNFNVDFAYIAWTTAGAFAPVPEPSTFALLAVGVVGFGCSLRRRRLV